MRGQAATTLSPEAVQIALRQRLRLPLPIASGRCGPSPGCGGPIDLRGDALACPQTGDPNGARGSGTRRPHCPAAMAGTHDGSPNRADRPSPPRLAHLWATPAGIALCCDATLVSPLTRTGQPQPCGADVDGAVKSFRRYVQAVPQETLASRCSAGI